LDPSERRPARFETILRGKESRRKQIPPDLPPTCQIAFQSSGKIFDVPNRPPELQKENPVCQIALQTSAKKSDVPNRLADLQIPR